MTSVRIIHTGEETQEPDNLVNPTKSTYHIVKRLVSLSSRCHILIPNKLIDTAIPGIEIIRPDLIGLFNVHEEKPQATVSPKSIRSRLLLVIQGLKVNQLDRQDPTHSGRLQNFIDDYAYGRVKNCQQRRLLDTKSKGVCVTYSRDVNIACNKERQGQNSISGVIKHQS
ncbi:hypothetical protein M433DRAFT_156613 [Acidomyces richmondensis BFW]|nr:hypothetical protein M433DRAFT_156613 [Acidomyces richmondensis BFW]